MNTHLQREIDKLKRNVLFMGAEVEDSVYRAVDCLVLRNAELAEEIIRSDSYIDQLEVEIEEECLKLLALHQPVATDLRYVIAVLKINNDLERIGDLAVNIAERAAYISVRPHIDLPLDFRGMADITQSMLKKSLDALVKTDATLATEVRTEDDGVDAMNRHMHWVITEYITKNPQRTEELLHLLSCSRHLERIADQCTNIAEDVIYMVQGEIVRHKPENFSSIDKHDDSTPRSE